MKSRKKQLIFVLLISVLLGIIFIISGYSFSINFFDFLLVGIIIIVSVILFVVYFKKRILKIIITVLIIVGFSAIAYPLFLFAVFSSDSEVKHIESWRVDNYEIELINRQDWAGPSHYVYSLRKKLAFGVLEKTIAKEYPGQFLSEDCIVQFRERVYPQKLLFQFDKCSETLTK